MKKIYETSEWQHVRGVMLEPSDIIAVAPTHSASEVTSNPLAMVSDHTFDEVKAVIPYNMPVLIPDNHNNIIDKCWPEQCTYEGEVFLLEVSIINPVGSEPPGSSIALVTASTAEKYAGEDDWMSLDEYFETLQ